MANAVQAPGASRRGANHITSRTLSIVAALAVDAGLVWLFHFRAKYNPPFGDAEMFWVRIVAGFGAYAVLQQWTLASQTGRGDDFAAIFDKLAAVSPLLIAAYLEAYAVSAGTWHDLSWRHHAVALLWAAFALTDFFSTDIANQRLRTCRHTPGNDPD